MAIHKELLLLDKILFLCVETVSCHMIEKTNRLSLKNKKLSVQVVFQSNKQP